MLKHIEGTEKTQELITEIIKNFMAQKPSTKHVDYEITIGKKKSLQTEENNSILRNVSIVKLGRLHVAIGNKTGDLLVIKKPFWITKNGILRKITKFLQKIQPESLINAKKIEKDSYADSSIFTSAPEQTRNSITYTVKRTKIKKTVIGSNADGRDEFIEEFKTL